MKITNVIGSSMFHSPNVTWIKYWAENATTSQIANLESHKCPFCSEPYSDKFIGGHVREVEVDHAPLYILPICRNCNNIPNLESYIDKGTENLLIPLPSVEL